MSVTDNRVASCPPVGPVVCRQGPGSDPLAHDPAGYGWRVLGRLPLKLLLVSSLAPAMLLAADRSASAQALPYANSSTGSPGQATGGTGGAGGTPPASPFSIDFNNASGSGSGVEVSIGFIGGVGGPGHHTHNKIEDADGHTGGAGGDGGAISVTMGSGSSLSTSSGTAVIALTGAGGAGGQGGDATTNGGSATGGSGGVGGSGAGISLETGSVSASSAAAAIALISSGGAGGAGNTGMAGLNKATGGSGGIGGAGGGITLETDGAVAGGGIGIEASSAGGTGGSGAEGGATAAYGGDGGSGGAGGTIGLTVNANVPAALAVQATSTGGSGGGAGEGEGAGGYGGQGGGGGAGGSVSLTTSSAAQLAASGATAAVLASAGGAGGTGGAGKGLAGNSGGSYGDGGAGGSGGQVTANLGGGVTTTGAAAGAFAVQASSTGGAGGSGALGGGVAGDGGRGGTGGTGGPVTVTVGNQLQSASGGVQASSIGGSGGSGAEGEGVSGQGGSGGGGGVAGQVTVALDQGGSITTSADGAPAIQAQANGGAGGAGGNSAAAVGNSGGGGYGGAGGAVTLHLDGQLLTVGAFSQGVLAQGAAGVGGNGANAFGVFWSNGGKGLAGGNGGTISVDGAQGSITTSGRGAAGLLVASIGGGGGSGGDADSISDGVSVTIGGNGGTGGAGQLVDIGGGGQSTALNDAITTKGELAPAILAQSIGGGGGSGGDARNAVLGVFAFAIGGDGAAGGDGGTVNLYNSGSIATNADHSEGILAQSVGGGGGKAGSAVSRSATLGTVTVAVGGNGGNGGTGGAVTIGNWGSIHTGGSDSTGLLAQSVSGGGGAGGSAVANALGIGVDPEIPTISVGFALGGCGGNGGGSDANNGGAFPGSSCKSGGASGTAGQVTVSNAGSIATLGAGSPAIVAQSIAGGGGAGGDASASSSVKGESPSLSLSIGIGGGGGAGGSGQAVTVTNDALLNTSGESGYGVLAQSIGGGGGNGGTGDAVAKTTGDADESLSLAISVGGAGGVGGSGGTVTLSNDSSGVVGTTGDGATGLAAQSVGGGGGAAGGGAGSAAGQMAIAVRIGGGGGSGGVGGTASVSNDGTIATAGADADALLAQSIGGGGGKGGKAATTLPGAGGAAGVGSGAGDDDDDDGSLALGVSIGGSGGSGNNGGQASVTNSNKIITTGPFSDGMFAESIGGGGGKGGAASASGLGGLLEGKPIQVGLGGSGGASGGGGLAQATSTGTITTSGDRSIAIEAQSIGGGGGDGGATTGADAPLNFRLGLGGSGGATGNGGQVSVSVTGQTVTTTSGNDASDVMAQSIGAGGGAATVMSVGGQGGSGVSQTGFFPSQATVVGVIGVPGDSRGASGNGGPVGVTLDSTQGLYGYAGSSGRDSYGVLTQSIGGGGGLIVGAGQADKTTLSGLFANAAMSGSGGSVSVALDHGFNIGTSGAGAAGVVAQSVGGGGGLIGGLSQVTLTNPIQASPLHTNNGQGGDVSVSVQNSADIVATGPAAYGIVAMSLGGGGGILEQAGGNGFVFANTASYNYGAAHVAPTGTVTITLGTNTVVRATGANSYAIYAASQGNGTNAVAINIGSDGYVESWAQSAGAIFVDGTGGTAGNVINNAGTIDDGRAANVPGGQTPNATGVAIAGNSPVTFNNTGVYSGSIEDPGSIINNQQAGVMYAGPVLDLGVSGHLSNQGVLVLGRSGPAGTTTLQGSFSQAPGGTLAVRLDGKSNLTDRLHATGTADVAGHVVLQVVNAASLAPGSARVDILTADGGVTNRGLQAPLTGSPVLQYAPEQADPATVSLSYTVDYAGAAALQSSGLESGNRNSVGSAFNAIQARGGAAGLSDALPVLLQVNSAQALASFYDSLSGTPAVDSQQVLFAAQQAYQQTLADHVWSQANGASGDPAAGAPTRVWIGGMGRTDLLAGTDGQRGLNAQTAGALLGVEHDAQGVTYGLSIGGGSSSFSVSGENSRGDDNSINVAVYGTSRFGSLYVTGILSYGHFSTTIDRYDFPQIDALQVSGHEDFDSNVAGGRIEVGDVRSIGAVSVTPYAALDLDELWQGGFAEAVPTGAAPGTAGLALRYGGVSRLSVPLTLGARVSTSLALGGHRLTPFVDLAWVHEFDPARRIEAAFAAAPDVPFAIKGVDASRDSAATSVGGTFSLTRRLSLLASFDGRFSGVETEYGGFGGVQLQW